MSATASASPTLARSSSASRRQPSYTSASGERPHRSQSTRVPSSSSSSQHPHSSHNRASSAAQRQSELSNVARRDFEDPNLPRQSASRRSTSQDRYGQSAPPPSSSSRAEQARRSSRQDSQGGAQPTSSQMDAATRSMAAATGAQPRRRTHVTGVTGTWQLQKTIGAGSMGKVKLARNQETGETVAVKIVPRVSTEEHRTQAEQERAEHSKEIRTAREAAIVSLVNHPYICGMRDVVKTSYHWYMLFEYVNGGQMLDYIISHGRLKEKQARKFGRQIASALDYCHRNSIVHRDLKIENILISKTGDIKIIDFGLSNLFSPQSHLKTFCGSLYFAAPELLQAKQYTGPEVDVWSFGIVLYVLVCGKVPFDDHSMPQLHAKIKKGHVDYPPWLSPECKNLIGRMLVTDPKQRCSLQEIMTHPWLTKGFGNPPENFLPHREPLTWPLDPAVIEKMEGFDFGPTEYITASLAKTIESDDYQRAVKNWTRRRADQTPDPDKKRGVFDFYKRRNSTSSRDALTIPSVEALQAGIDPINAYNPMISVYFLVREKMERERQEANPGALSIPPPDHGKPFEIPNMPSAPVAAYTNHMTPETAGERPTGGRTRPRARTNGEDELADSLGQMRVNEPQAQNTPQIVTSPAEPTPAKKESTAGSILRRLSTRRSRADRPERPDRSHPPTVAVSTPADGTNEGSRPLAGMRRSFSVRRNRDRDVPSTNSLQGAATEQQQQQTQDGLLSPTTAGDGFGKRLRGLGRSASVNSSELRRRVGRRGASEGGSVSNTATEVPPTSGSDGSSFAVHANRTADAPAEQVADTPVGRTKTLGHARRESIQNRRLHRRETSEQEKAQDTADTEAEVVEHERPRRRLQREERVSASESMKPVYLKGLFSVSTTSNRPLSEIHSEIVRVLHQRGVEFHEIKGGFSCRHAPSIIHGNEKENRNAFPPSDAASPRAMDFSPPQSQPSTTSAAHRRKISFGVDAFRSKDRDDLPDSQRGPQTPRTPRTPRQSSNAHNIVGPSVTADNAADVEGPSDESETSDRDQQLKPIQPQPTESSARGALRDGTVTHVMDDAGDYGALKFEIFIVKVPLLSLHGIQFKKVEGNVMSYKNMAQEILRGLRL